MKVNTWLITITPGECEQLLAESSLGRIAVIVNGRPEIFPVNHVFDHETRCVAFPTNDRTKLHAALDWPFVAFEIDAMNVDEPSGWSVLVVGRAEEITDSDEIARISTARTAVWRTGESVHWVRIVPEKVSGRRIFGPSDSIRVDLCRKPLGAG